LGPLSEAEFWIETWTKSENNCVVGQEGKKTGISSEAGRLSL